MLARSIRRLLLQHQHGVRCYVPASTTVDLYTEMKQYPFIKTFLNEPNDPVKQKWDIIKSWSEQCQGNPKIEQKQFKFLRQRYELFPMYNEPELIEGNPFLEDIFERIKDDPQYDKPNMKSLSDAQFEATYRILQENLAVRSFLDQVPDLMEKAQPKIAELPYRKFDYAKFEQSVAAWGKYKFLSFGHPYIAHLRQKMIINGGTLPVDEIVHIVYYMKGVTSYKFANKDFNDTLKWYSKMNWIMEHKLASNTKESVYHLDTKDYWVVMYNKYTHIKDLIEDPKTQQGCTYKMVKEDKEITPDANEIQLWLCRLAKKENDPLINILKEPEDSTFDDLQKAIINRFQLDIGGLMDKFQDPLVALLLNEHLPKFDQTGEIIKHRKQVLMGKELNDKYINELKEMTKKVQTEFSKAM